MTEPDPQVEYDIWTEIQRATQIFYPKAQPPYPWCHGSPTKEACAERGYCNRNPSCGD